MNNQWYIGQKVVCVIPIAPWLKMGAVHTIKWIGSVCGCGPAVCVGIPSGTGATKCSLCGKYCEANTIVFDARRFRPIDALTETMERIEREGAPLELEPA